MGTSNMSRKCTTYNSQYGHFMSYKIRVYNS